MAKQTGGPIGESQDHDAALLVLIGVQRDELHRFAAEIAEDLATPARHLEVADRLCRLGQQLGSRAHRLAIGQRSSGAVMPDDRKLLAEPASLNSDSLRQSGEHEESDRSEWMLSRGELHETAHEE